MVTISNKYFSIGIWCKKKVIISRPRYEIGLQFNKRYKNGIKKGFFITNRELSFSERQGYKKYKKLPFGFRYENIKIQ